MANRLFNGRTNSENGWPYVDQDSCTWVTIPGTNPPVRLQIQNGQPLLIMRAFAADFNANVEPLSDEDSACWTPGNSVPTSNHPGGTAMDLDWKRHRFQISYDGFSPAQIATCRELLDFYEKTIFWGQDWGGNPYDCMHWQMNRGTWGAENVARVQDFINRKIRADGFSTFRRGGAPPVPPPPPPVDAMVDVLVRATGITVGKAQSILPTLLQGLALSQCTNVKRIAMWLAQIGLESASFVYTEEIQSGDESTDRWKYKGRTWIQITWSYNYAAFSKWLFDKGLISSPTYFLDNPKQLADERWAGIGPAWYWTVARPQINALCDAGDIVAVTQAINGGQNGADQRKARYDRALALGDQLLVLVASPAPQPPSPDEGFLMALPENLQWDMYHALMNQRQSRSPLREPGEGTVGDMPDQLWDMDGSIHVIIVELLARLGDPSQVALLQRVASNSLPDRQADKALAQAILNSLAARSTAKTTLDPGESVTVMNQPPLPQKEYVYLPAPVVPEPVPVVNSTAGQAIGKLYDALEELRLADALPIEGRAPLAALIAVLQTKNGSQV